MMAVNGVVMVCVCKCDFDYVMVSRCSLFTRVLALRGGQRLECLLM